MGSYRRNPLPVVSILFIILTSTGPLSVARLFGGEHGLKKEILMFQSLQQGNVPSPGHSNCTNAQGKGRVCPNLYEKNFAAMFHPQAPASEEAYSQDRIDSGS
ncbi:hypothetical protein MRB53_026922 [Persea americana]|uniref:Uncharacterized protein n=1 Tax=Persea americana TaxID=3435 RepID=A0ACC2LJH5_PERAE|nr:hypothetical protein MRB53_026922 [Persea americana]